MNMDQLYFAIRKLRKEMSNKIITQKIILQYFQLFDPDVDFDIIQKYLSLQKGSLYLQDFISILMLINHHQHINLSLGYFLELNNFIKEFEHSLFLQQIDKFEELELKQYNQYFELVSENYDVSQNLLKIQFEANYQQIRESNFSIVFLTQYNHDNFSRMQNRGSFTLQKDDNMTMFKLIDQHVECPFFDELFQMQDFQVKTLFECNMNFDRLLNSGDQTLKEKSEFCFKTIKRNWNQNLQGLFENVLRNFMLQYQDSKLMKVQEFLQSNMEGKITLDQKSKLKFLDEVFKREDRNEVNLICSLLLDILDYSLEQTDGEKKNIIKQLSRNKSKFFVAKLTFYGFTFELSIAQENCQSIFELLELKLEDFQQQRQIDSQRNIRMQEKVNKKLKIDELLEFRKQFVQAEDKITKNIQKKYQSNKEEDIYDIRSEQHIRFSLNQIYKNRFSSRKIDDYLDKTGDTFKKKNQTSADNFEKNGKMKDHKFKNKKQQDTDQYKRQNQDQDNDIFTKKNDNDGSYDQNIKKKENIGEDDYNKKNKNYDSNKFVKRDQNEVDNYIDPNDIMQDIHQKKNKKDAQQFDQKNKQNQMFEYMNKDQKGIYDQTQRKQRNQTEVAYKQDQFKIQLYQKKMKMDIYNQQRPRLKFNRLIQSTSAFLSLFHQKRKHRRQTRKSFMQDQIAKLKDDPDLFMSFAGEGSQKRIRRFKLKPIAFSIKIWLNLYKHVQKNRIQKIFHGFAENNSQIIEYIPDNQKLILKRNTIIFSVKVFVGLLNYIRKRKIIQRIRSYTGKKPLIRRGTDSKLFVTAFSIKVFLSLFKFVQQKKIKQTSEKFQYQRAYKNIQKFKIIVKSLIVFKNFIKRVKRRETIGHQRYDRLQEIKKRAFFKIRILLIFKGMVQFTKRKKTLNIKFGIKQDLKFKLKTRFLAVQRFMALYKFVQKKRVTKRKISFLKLKRQLDREKLGVIKAKVIAINKFLYLYRFVQFQRLTRRAQSLDDFNPQRIVIVRQPLLRFGKFHAIVNSVIAFKKLYNKTKLKKILPRKSQQILPYVPRSKTKVKFFYLAKCLYIFKNLYNFTKSKKVTHSRKRYSLDLDYDVKLIKKFQYFGFTIQQIVELQRIYSIQKNKRKKLSFKCAAFIALTLNKLYRETKYNKTRAISQQVLRQTIQIDIPKFYKLKHVAWWIFGFLHLYKKSRMKRKRTNTIRIQQIQFDKYDIKGTRTAYPKLYAFSKFCHMLQIIRNKKIAEQNRTENLKKLKTIIRIMMMFQSFYKEIKKNNYRKQLKRQMTFGFESDHWLRRNHSQQSISEYRKSLMSQRKKYKLKTVAQSVSVFLKLFRFTQKKRGRIIRNQTFFNKNKREVIEYRRFSTFSAKTQSQKQLNTLLINTNHYLNNSLQDIQNNPQTNQQKAHYMFYCISKYIIEKNEKTIDFFFESQMQQQQDRGRKRTISFTMSKLRKSKQKIQEFDIPDIDEDDQEFADVNYYNKFLNMNQQKEVDEDQIQRVRKSITKRQSKSRTYSKVTSILDTLQQDDFQVSKIQYFNIQNVKRQAKLVQNQTKLHKIMEKKNRTLSVRRGTVSKKDKDLLYPIIVDLNQEKKQLQIHENIEEEQQSENENDNIFKDDSFANKKSVQIHNVLDYTEDISDQSAQDKSVKSFVLVKNINSFNNQLILKEYCRFNYTKKLRIGRNLGQKRKKN